MNASRARSSIAPIVAAVVIASLGCGGDAATGPGSKQELPVQAPPPVVAISFPLQNVVLYNSSRYGGSDLMIVDLAGSRKQRVSGATGLHVCPAISPSGDAIFFGEGILVTAQGSTQFATGSCGRFSPDGNSILAQSSISDGSVLTVYARTGVAKSRMTGTPGGTFVSGGSWSPDGKLISISRCTLIAHGPCEPSHIFLVPSDSLDSPAAVRDLGLGTGPATFSPDSKNVVFGCDATSVCVEPVSGGGARSLGLGTSPAWSPKDNVIAFLCGEFVCTMDGNGGNRVQLSARAKAFKWSPDGKALLLAWGRTNNDLFIVSADGSNLHNITNDRGIDVIADWAPVSPGATSTPGASVPAFSAGSTDPLGGSWILYQGLRQSGSVVRAIRDDGTGDANLFATDMDETCPAISPDRRLVAFQSLGLWVARVDGSAELQLADTAGNNGRSCPVWSPDGTRVAWMAWGGTAFTQPMQLWVGAIDGSAPMLLAEATEIRAISWRPDSKGLFYQDLYNSRMMSVLIGSAPTVFGQAGWSSANARADGSVVVDCGSKICLTDLGGSAFRVVATGRKPLFSPDGRKIVFLSEDPASLGYFVLDADGTNLRSVAKLDEYPQWVSWSPNSDAISFEAHKNVGVAFLGGNTSLIASANSLRPVWSASRWSMF